MHVSYSKIKKTAYIVFVLVTGLAIGIVMLVGMGRGVHAAWEEPSAQPPEGNIYAPLTVGPEKQAKKGNLILDPLYNPFGATPSTNYPLDVRGQRDVYINTFSISTGGNLTVDTDTLSVSGTGHNVGMGTATPIGTVKLDIANGTANAGSMSTPISNGPAISINSSGSTSTAAYGSSTADAQASVSGSSVADAGVYGLNQSSGSGVSAYSLNASALVGIINTPFDPTSVVAAVYGEASGIGAWAGYFQQRVYSDASISGGKFVPNRLRLSQIPYTAGWEVRSVADGATTVPHLVVYANGYVWSSDLSWDSNMHANRAENGEYVAEIVPYGPLITNPASNYYNHELRSMIYAGGYVWIGGGNGGGTALITRMNPDPANPDVRQYNVGTSPITTVQDITYDSVTAGGPYIWAAAVSNSTSYAIIRVRVSDGATTTITADANAKCLSYRYSSTCSDRLDNDTNGTIDRGLCTFPAATDQSSCTSLGSGYVWTPGVCSDTTYADQASCTGAGQKWAASACSNSANSGSCTGTWVNADANCSADSIPGSSPYNPATDPNQLNNEKLQVRPFGDPSGIVLDTVTAGGPYLWLSFGDNRNGDGILRVKISDQSQTAFCTGPGRLNSDIDFDPGNDQLWLGHGYSDNYPATYHGISRVSAVTGQVSAEYVTGAYPNMHSVSVIKYDGASSGGPYVWAGTAIYYNQLNKFRISDASIQQTYAMPTGVYDITFDRMSTGNPYVWSALPNAGALARSLINSPYTTSLFPVKSTTHSDAVFDGTYVWTANSGSNTVSRFLPSDSSRISEVSVGGSPQSIIYDGASIWTVNGNLTVSKIDRSTNAVTTYITNVSYGSDAVYDGANMWIVDPVGNRIYRIRLTSCTGASGSTCTDVQTISGLTDVGTPAQSVYPNRIIFDGTSLWVAEQSNRVSKVSTAGAIQATYTIAEISATPNFNIWSLLFDGTYIWVGTNKNDADGNSIFQIDPGLSSGTTASVVRKMKVYHDPGECSAGANVNQTCFSDAQCPGAICNNTTNTTGSFSRVQQLLFDGTYVWAASNPGFDYNMPRVCADGIDNDGDGKIDRQTGNVDPGCVDSFDMSETDPGPTLECSDHLDNDGNGKCDYDGAASWPGCSGVPDPGCSSAADASEAGQPGREYVTRILAATGQTIDSSPIGHYCGVYGLVFDGTNVWTAGTGCDEGYSLHQLYSGTGLGSADTGGGVKLQQNKAVGSINQQTGSFTLNGSGTFGAGLLVQGDLVVSANTWGGVDASKAYGTGCDNGQFVKGINNSTSSVTCRSL